MILQLVLVGKLIETSALWLFRLPVFVVFPLFCRGCFFWKDSCVS